MDRLRNILTTDTKPFKEDMHEIIGRGSIRPDELPGVLAEIDATVRTHRMALSKDYGTHVARLMLIGDTTRARRLVDCFGDRHVSRAVESSLLAAIVCFKLLIIVAIVTTLISVVGCTPGAAVADADPTRTESVFAHDPSKASGDAVRHDALPPGFEARDRFSDMETACAVTTRELVPERHAAAVVDWCDHRTYHASRGVVIVSRVDGTQIHDRDRPTSWRFYQRGVARGWLDPEGCPFHAIDHTRTHREATGPERKRRWSCIDLANKWPFKRPKKLSVEKRDRWLRSPHDMERFGARGPHDWNANAYRYLPGCWDPESLERHDVAAYVTVKRSAMICEVHGCRSKWDIKKHWRSFSPRRE